MATATTSAFLDRDFYVPRFELFVGDKPERGALLHDVMQVVYKDSVEAIDTFELTVNNWDAELRRFKHHDSDKLDPGRRIRLHLGYLNDRRGLRLMLQGSVTEMTPSFPATGQPTLKIVGQNVLNDFCKKRRSVAYPKQSTASTVADRICGELGVLFRNDTPHRADEFKHDHLIQNNQFDILFLRQLARSEGYDVVIEEPPDDGPTTLRFNWSGTAQVSVLRMRYGAGLIEFQPTFSTSKRVSSVVVDGWDEAKGERIHEEVGQPALEGSRGIQAKLIPGTRNPVENRQEVLANQPVRDRQAAAALAAARLAANNQELVTGSGSVVGIPELRCGTRLDLFGLGLRFSGRYFVTSTTHTLGMSGYTTQFECRLEELRPDPHEEPAR
jgi:uncharacterized protein